jgi:hypothetical protein
MIKAVMWMPNGKCDMGRQKDNCNYRKMKGRDLKEGQSE